MKKIVLDKNGIHEVQQNRDPYLLIDYASEVIPGKSAKGYKDLNEEEWIFKVHWPNDPNMPGMLQLEAMSQTASLALFSANIPPSKLYLASVDKAIFRRKVVPESLIQISATLIAEIRNIYKFKCKIISLPENKTCNLFEILMNGYIMKLYITLYKHTSYYIMLFRICYITIRLYIKLQTSLLAEIDTIQLLIWI